MKLALPDTSAEDFRITQPFLEGCLNGTEFFDSDRVSAYLAAEAATHRRRYLALIAPPTDSNGKFIRTGNIIHRATELALKDPNSALSKEVSELEEELRIREENARVYEKMRVRWLMMRELGRSQHESLRATRDNAEHMWLNPEFLLRVTGMCLLSTTLPRPIAHQACHVIAQRPDELLFPRVVHGKLTRELPARYVA